MTGKFLRHIRLGYLIGAVGFSGVLCLSRAQAQTVVQDTTIASTASFTANAITVGPGVTVAATGVMHLGAKSLAVTPELFVVTGGSLIFRLVDLVTPGTESAVLPEEFVVHQNFPNPFWLDTEIRFELPEAKHVVITVYNSLGHVVRVLADRHYPAGFHRVRWDGQDAYGRPLSSGVYLYQVEGDRLGRVKKMSLLR